MAYPPRLPHPWERVHYLPPSRPLSGPASPPARRAPLILKDGLPHSRRCGLCSSQGLVLAAERYSRDVKGPPCIMTLRGQRCLLISCPCCGTVSSRPAQHTCCSEQILQPTSLQSMCQRLFNRLHEILCAAVHRTADTATAAQQAFL